LFHVFQTFQYAAVFVFAQWFLQTKFSRKGDDLTTLTNKQVLSLQAVLHDVELTSIKKQFVNTYVAQAERLRLMLTRLGPAFVKIGQVSHWNIPICQHRAIEMMQIAGALFSLPYCILLAAGYQDYKLLACIHSVAFIDACLQSERCTFLVQKRSSFACRLCMQAYAFQAGFYACTTSNELITMH